MGFLGVVGMLMAQLATAQEIKPVEVNQGVRTELQHILTSSGSELRVEDVLYRYLLKLPDGVVQWVVEGGSSSLSPGRQDVAVSVMVDGKLEKAIRVPANLKLVIRVPVVLAPLQRGDTIGAQDIEWREITTVRAIPGLVQSEEDVAGMAAVRRIQEGVPLQLKWFETPMAVDRGDRVRVKVSSGKGLNIETVAVALEKGRVGDTIQLRNPDSQMRYEAKIIGPGAVQLGAW